MNRTSVRLCRLGPVPRPASRRGSAIVTVVLITIGIAAIATSAIYLSGNATILTASYDRERGFKYASEAALAIGKSRLNYDPLALPDSGYTTLLSNQTIQGADGSVLPGVTVNLYVGQSGSTSGQFGRFASIVAEARDAGGARFVRRLEVAQESFARYAYWSHSETNTSGTVIFFGGGDNLWGPVWSNDVMSIHTTGATFHDEVGTAQTISQAQYGVFNKGYSINQPPITLPNNTTLSNLPGYAAAANFSFTPPTNGGASGVRARIEFVAVDLGTGTSDSTGTDEGFMRVYVANSGQTAWLRGDWNSTKASATNCGAFYPVTPGGPPKFFPASMHSQTWVRDLVQAGGLTLAQANAATIDATMATIMSKPTARCFLGGDPHLVAEERNSASFTNAQKRKGGDDTTFTATGARGAWVQWPGAVDSRLATKRPRDAAYLFPLHRSLNPGTKGVIYANGTMGISGVLRGRVTVYSSADIVLLDDLRYASDPSQGRCADILGVLSAKNVTVADNAILGPQLVSSAYKNFDDTKDVFLHGVVMTLNTSFSVENYGAGPTTGNQCEGTLAGRGCLYLTGGLIQYSRGAVGTSAGYGYIKRYAYDRCAAWNPPPYFPTTGRFVDNRYYEIDPPRFDVAQLFERLVP